MGSNKLENYLALVTIRQKAVRRDTFIAGGVFLVSCFALIAIGMLGRLSGRTLYLVIAMVMSFGFAYLAAWVKLEIIKGSIELINNLLLMNEG